MTIALYIVAAVIIAVWSLYLAWRNREFRKFLAGAFFVSSGILFYLYLTDVSVPLLGTNFVETPQISGGRSIVHFFSSFCSVPILASSGKLKAGNGRHPGRCPRWVKPTFLADLQKGKSRKSLRLFPSDFAPRGYRDLGIVSSLFAPAPEPVV